MTITAVPGSSSSKGEAATPQLIWDRDGVGHRHVVVVGRRLRTEPISRVTPTHETTRSARLRIRSTELTRGAEAEGEMTTERQRRPGAI
jgi:hypothetical protein